MRMPRTARRRRRRAIVANAFVALGRYYLERHPELEDQAPMPERAREMFSYAASYFGNADAQYDLARLYLKGVGAPREISAMARAGSALPRRRASMRRRRCSARCCSTATVCRGRPRAA